MPAAKTIRRALLLIIPVLLLAGWMIWRQLQGPELPGYRLETRPLVQRVVASGEVDSQSLAQVGSEITGVIAVRHVREGDAVKAGDLLLELRDWANHADSDVACLLQDSDARAALFTSDFQRTLQQQLRNRELDGWQATSLLNDLNYLDRIRRHLLRGHAGLGQGGGPVNDEERLEQAVNLA